MDEKEQVLAILNTFNFTIAKHQKLIDLLVEHPEFVLQLQKKYKKEQLDTFFKGILPYVEPLIFAEPIDWNKTRKNLLEILNILKNYNYIFVKYMLSNFVEKVFIGFNLEQFSVILQDIIKSGMHDFKLPKTSQHMERNLFLHDEVVVFFLFVEKIMVIFKEEKINTIFSIDKKGRLVGFLFFLVLSKIGYSGGVKSYNILATKAGRVIMSDKIKKESLVGKNILLLDEYVETGTTMEATKEFLENLVGPTGKIIACAPYAQFPKEKYHSIKAGCPMWYSEEDTRITGVAEKQDGTGVERQLDGPSRKVKVALSRLSNAIAKYLVFKKY